MPHDDALTSDEFALLGVLLDVGDAERLSALASWFPGGVAQSAVAGLHERGLLEIDRVERLSEGQTVDRAVSPITPDVRSSSNLVVATLSYEEAAAVIAHPASWLEAITSTWFEVCVREPAATEAYSRQR